MPSPTDIPKESPVDEPTTPEVEEPTSVDTPEVADETPQVDEKLRDLGVRTNLTVRADAIFAELLALTEDDKSLAEVKSLIKRLHNAVRHNIYHGQAAEAVKVLDIAEKVLTHREEDDESMIDGLLDIGKYLPGVSKVDKLIGRFFESKGGEIEEVQTKLASLREDIVDTIPEDEVGKLDEEKPLSSVEREEKSKELEEKISKSIDENLGFFKFLGIGQIQKGALALAVGRGLTDVDEQGEPIHEDVQKFIDDPSAIGLFMFAIGNLFGSKKRKGTESVQKLRERLETYEGNEDEIFFEEQSDISVFSQDRFHIVAHTKKNEVALQIGAHFYIIEKDDGFELSDDKIQSVDITKEQDIYTLEIKVDGSEYEIGLNNFLATNGISDRDPKESISIAGDLTLERKDDEGFVSRLKKYIPGV